MPSRTKRLATTIAAVLVLFVTALPAATACCRQTPCAPTASMHASMPCCAGECTMSSPNSGRDRDVTLAPAAPLQLATAVTLTATTPAPQPLSAIAPAGDAGSAPAPFLLHSQFRI